LVKNLIISIAAVITLIVMGYVTHFLVKTPEKKEFREIIENDYRIVIFDESRILLNPAFKKFKLTESNIERLEHKMKYFLDVYLDRDINCKLAILPNYKDFVQIFSVHSSEGSQVPELAVEFVQSKIFDKQMLMSINRAIHNPAKDKAETRVFLTLNMESGDVNFFHAMGPQCSYFDYIKNGKKINT